MQSLFVASVLVILYELCSADLEGLIFLILYIVTPPAFTLFLISLSQSSLSCNGEEQIEASQLGLCALRSFPLCQHYNQIRHSSISTIEQHQESLISTFIFPLLFSFVLAICAIHTSFLICSITWSGLKNTYNRICKIMKEKVQCFKSEMAIVEILKGRYIGGSREKKEQKLHNYTLIKIY